MKSLMISILRLNHQLIVLGTRWIATREDTYGTKRSRTPLLVARCASLGSRYIRNRTLISVAAALDSCLSRLGSCFMKPDTSAPFPCLIVNACDYKRKCHNLPALQSAVRRSLSALNLRANFHESSKTPIKRKRCSAGIVLYTSLFCSRPCVVSINNSCKTHFTIICLKMRR